MSHDDLERTLKCKNNFLAFASENPIYYPDSHFLIYTACSSDRSDIYMSFFC